MAVYLGDEEVGFLTPITTSGTIIADTTAISSDVLNNKVFYTADGTRTTGTATLGTKNITESGTYSASSDNLSGYSSVSVNIPNPILATTDAEMAELLISSNDGKVVKFTGTSETYETDTYYVIEEEES